MLKIIALAKIFIITTLFNASYSSESFLTTWTRSFINPLWALRNGLELNTRKTKAMIVGSMQYIACINLQTICKMKVNGTPIEFVSSAKNLGFTSTDTLNWQPLINSLLGKVYSALSTLCFHKSALSSGLRTQLVKTLVFPNFDYASLIYMDLDLTRVLHLKKKKKYILY